MRWLRFAGLDRALLGTIVVHVVVRALYADFVPLYDSRQYFDLCAVPYLAHPTQLLRLNCFGHPSLAFMALIAWVQALDLGNTYLLHGTTTLLGVASIVAFHSLLGRVLVAPELLWERRLLLGCYGLAAQCLSIGVNFNPDYGVLVFFVLMLERLLAGRAFAAALWGVGLVLSKEAGILLYGVAIATFVLHAWIRPRTYPPRAELLRSSLAFGAPLALFALVKLAERSHGMPAMWGGQNTLPLLIEMFTTLSLLDPLFLVYTFDVFGLGYAWLLGLPLLVAAGASLLRWLVDRPKPATPGLDARNVRIVLTLFALAFLLLTRFRTFNNVRYFGALYPLFVVSAGWALCALELRAEVRRLVLALALALTFSFNFHSLDPLSQSLFGTFSFGRHELLHMGAPDQCCGYGRDQLAYNFELTELHYVQNEVYRALRPRPDTVLVASDLADFHFAGRIDARTFERTLRFENSYEIEIHDASVLLRMNPLPERVYFLVLPNFDNRAAYALLSSRYREVAQRTFSHGDYAIKVHTLERLR